MDGEHPCNICTNQICKQTETYGDCVWQHVYSKFYSCNNYDCMLEYEGMCLGSFYGRCGAMMDKEG